ncbi:SH3 domain-containing protein [Rahnella aquatilis]|uniref:SH3 domain-containing protein n=1 Tax=Rahnella aquatilis (strain ATCC 33071 / DSM 4594 / JCM 1683 / NBRC 105701 / NCIMB 13365 / CIP 78.65) TaxID=745277 RepID=H2J1M5_RAHAC|nr:SH3 domain-containing protein [Rahnella aquatilis]AEX54472.1 SH3 domain-containing protein [Rahnella aquatilis CIP 78.65 = ATCC 33071]
MNSLAKVIKEHRSSYPNPITLRENEIVMISHCDLEWRGWIWIRQSSGNAGWAPQQIFTLSAPDRGICTENYTAYELSVAPGEVLTLEKKLNGWFWACNKSGESGWVPEENLMNISK